MTSNAVSVRMNWLITALQPSIDDFLRIILMNYLKSKGFILLKRMLFLALGAMIYASGVALFLDPHGIAPGGVTGIAVLLRHFTGWYTGFTSLAMNIPLLIAGLVRFGKDFLISTIFSTVVSSLTMSALAKLIAEAPHLVNDDLLSSLVGSALMGVGMGIVFRHGGTTGGTDIVVKFLRQKYRSINSGSFFMIIDSAVVLATAVVYKNFEMGLYSGIAVVACSLVLNSVLYGTDTARLVYIITTKPDAIADRLLDDLSLGVTYIHGEGAFTREQKNVILCACRKQIFPQVKMVVRDEDPGAFMIVSSANEIYGEGFKKNSNIEI